MDFSPSDEQKMMIDTVRRFIDEEPKPLEPVSLLGEEEQGFKLAMGAFNVVRLAQVGARAVGKASHVCELMVGYAASRKQINTSIGDFQMVQQMLADSVIEINAACWMVHHAAWMPDQGQDARRQIAMVKVHVAETQGRVVDQAVRARFLATQKPRNLTMTHALGIGDKKTKQMSCFAHEGLMRKVIGGHWRAGRFGHGHP